jgi:hypothetical protein
LREGASGFLLELAGAEWSGVRGYFEPHRKHTDDVRRMAAGQAIGSGRVEGECKHLSGRRLKPTGAPWKGRRVERMTTLCAVQTTDQWNAHWDKVIRPST